MREVWKVQKSKSAKTSKTNMATKLHKSIEFLSQYMGACAFTSRYICVAYDFDMSKTLTTIDNFVKKRKMAGIFLLIMISINYCMCIYKGTMSLCVPNMSSLD